MFWNRAKHKKNARMHAHTHTPTQCMVCRTSTVSELFSFQLNMWTYNRKMAMKPWFGPHMHAHTRSKKSLMTLQTRKDVKDFWLKLKRSLLNVFGATTNCPILDWHTCTSQNIKFHDLGSPLSIALYMSYAFNGTTTSLTCTCLEAK